MTDTINVRDFVLKCNRLPIRIVIEGDGCLEIWNDGFNNRNRLCGPGEFVLTNIKVGTVNIYAIPEKGMSIDNLIGLPKNKDTHYNKPYYEFYYDGRYYNTKTESGNMLDIKAIFNPAKNFSKPPADNALGI